MKGRAELAEDQDFSSSRYPADGLFSEQCAWHLFYAPVDPVLGSDSDTALPCCGTLTTLILKLTQNPLQWTTENARGRMGAMGRVFLSGRSDSGPADTFVERANRLHNVAINTKPEKL